MEDIKMTLKTVICISLIVISLMLPRQGSAAIDKKTIVGLWFFDEGSGGDAKDSSGKGNDGKLMNGPKWVEGKSKKALEFDNSGAYVDCGNDKSLDLNSFTLAVWVFPTAIDTSTHEMVLGKGWASPDGRSYYMSILQGKPFVSFRDPGNTAQADVKGTTDLQKSTWYHMAGTHNRKTKKVAIYLDGEKEDEKEFDYDVMVTTKHLWIGNLGDHELFFGGKIDEVAVFNVALNDADIKSVMNGGIKAVFAAGKLTTTWAEIKNLCRLP